MEYFSVKISGFNQGIAEEEALIKQLKNLKAEIESVKLRIDFQVKGRTGVISSFNDISAELERDISVWNDMKVALEKISNKYQFTENRNSGIGSSSLSVGVEIGSLVAGSGGGGGGAWLVNGASFGVGAEIPRDEAPYETDIRVPDWRSDTIAKISPELGAKMASLGNSKMPEWWDEIKGEISPELLAAEIASLGSSKMLEPGVEFPKGSIFNGLDATKVTILNDVMNGVVDESKFKHEIYNEKQGKGGKKREFTKEDGKWVAKDVEEYGSWKETEGKNGTETSEGTKSNEETDKGKKNRKKILENITIASRSKDFVSSALWTDGFVNGDTSGSLTISERKIYGNASLTATGAQIGAGITYTALQGNIERKIGDENFGGHVSGDYAVGKVEVKGGFKATALDEDGNPELNIGVNGSIEAIAMEVNLTTGMNLGDVDVSVKGGMTVGIGWHADVGFYDGKIKFDVGGALGLGVSADLEIDVSKPIENIVEFGSGAVDVIQTGWDYWSKGANVDLEIDVSKPIENIATGWDYWKKGANVIKGWFN